ncbi:MAG TPA: tetratricopeptide repeat protein [Mucilaginibacter sp.]|jgi:signal transduction histidine kinase
MKKILLLFLLVLCHLKFLGQEIQIKKLDEQLKGHPQTDTFRVNRLNELGQLFRDARVSNEKFESTANEALSISRKISYATGEGNALANLGWIKSQRGEKQAFILLQQAAVIAEQTDDKILLVNAWLISGSAKQRIGENKDALFYYLKADSVALKFDNKILISRCQASLSSLYQSSFGDFAKAMEWAFKAEKSAEDANDLRSKANAWNGLAAIYTTLGDQVNALIYYKKALAANKTLGNTNLEFNLLNRIGEMYRLTGKYPEALKTYQEGLSKTKLPYNIELTESNMADVYVKMGNLPLAFKYAFRSLNTAQKINDTEGIEWINSILANAYLKQNKPDSALFYAKSGYTKAIGTGTLEFKRDNSQAMADAYVQKGDFANAYKVQNLYIAYRDSMSSSEVTNKTSVLQYNYDLAKKQAQITALNQEKKLQRYFLTGAFIVMGLIAVTVIILLRNNRQKQKANVLLSKQKHMIEEQRDQTNKALVELQITQKQLIQSEKMASLGELTAGIAHEIQNPLNFINNFSEVNTELIDEMKQEIERGNFVEVKTIADDIKENQQKINQHGKRADFIVKGMLQHSRTNTGERQLTNINLLADEFFKLSYHGLRAKDKSFNSEMMTDFDPDLPKANIIQQEIGRVLLNLFNNGFYAVSQKKKTAGADYRPEVSVATLFEKKNVVIKVKDNGNGIPENIKSKIMQPFFTTKPTGEGTGLGLSLTYDMVVKGHGGSIDIDTKEGKYTEFIITLPLG